MKIEVLSPYIPKIGKKTLNKNTISVVHYNILIFYDQSIMSVLGISTKT